MNTRGGMKIVLLMCVGVFICMLDSTIMNITLPAIQKSLHTSLETSSWMLNVYTMTIAVLAIPMARFADMLGKNKFYLLGLFIFGVGSALSGFAESGSLLIGARFLQSIGAAILIPCSMVIGIGAMPLEKRTVPLSLLGATQGLSTALGPSIGGMITEKLNWHWVFYVNVPLCILAMIVSFFLLNIKGETRVRTKIDWLGLLCSILAVFSVNLVLINGNSWGWESNPAIVCYLLSIVSILSFIFTEKKVKAPMVNFKLFTDRLFTGSVITVAVGYIFLVGVMVLLPQFLTNFQHKTELQAAMLVTPVSAAIFIFANFAGLLIKKIGFVIPVFMGFGIMGTAYYLLYHLTIQTTAAEMVLLCSLLGLGFSFVISAATIASTSIFEGEMLMSSQSVFSMIRQVGVVLAVAIFVAGLTNNIQQKKQDVVFYAKQELEGLDLQQSIKEQIYMETKNSINTDSTPPKDSYSLQMEKEREQLIEMNAQKAMASVPEKQRTSVKGIIYQKTAKQVDKEMAIKEEIINHYVQTMSRYAHTTISSGFADLYKASVPFVFLSCLTGLLFRKRVRKKAAMQLANNPAAE